MLTPQELPPTLNFVWIGPPASSTNTRHSFPQDRIGPLSFHEQFKTFSTSPNPMVFWCEEDYLSYYLNDFKEKNISIQVRSVSNYFKESPLFTRRIANIYQTLTAVGRYSIRDRVTLKNLFFNILLANEGGYVLDTNIEASTELSCCLPTYSTFMYPVINGVHEVWLQYAPMNNHYQAISRLRCFLELYEYVDTLPYGPNTKTYHEYMGLIATQAVQNLDNFSLSSSTSDLSMPSSQWLSLPTGPNHTELLIPDLQIIKHYFNTHTWASLQKSLCKALLNASIDLLEIHLQQGINFNTVVFHATYDHPQRITIALPLILVIYQLKHIPTDSPQIETILKTIDWLLQHGAHPMKNDIYQHPVETEGNERHGSPLQICESIATELYADNRWVRCKTLLHAACDSISVASEREQHEVRLN